MNEQEQRLRALWVIAKKFIDDQHIRSAESVYQSDRVMENAPMLIEDMCNLIGYYEDPEVQ